MVKTKHNMLMRLAAFLLVLITLMSGMSIPAEAGDTAFLETLINTEKKTYVANFTNDTKTKHKKYAYQYMNMAFVLGEGCGGALDDDTTDPNKCFRLTQSYEYSKNTYLSDDSKIQTSTAINMFMVLEGYVDSNGDLILEDSNKVDAVTDKHSKIIKKRVKKTTSPLSFPGYYTETVTNEQSEYAQQVLTGLVGGLNAILNEVNAGQKFNSVTDLVNKSILIRPDDSSNSVRIEPNTKENYPGYVIVYADLTNVNSTSIMYETSAGQANRQLKELEGIDITVSSVTGSNSSNFFNTHNLPRSNQDKWLYAYVFPIVNKGGVEYLKTEDAAAIAYAAPKGFNQITYSLGGNNVVFSDAKFTESGYELKYIGNQKDVHWISIHMLSMYANTVYKQYNVSVSTYVEPDSNVISKIIAGIFTGILAVIRSVLGLSDIDTLVFNLGSRGSAAFNYGLMSENWWNVVLQYQLIFQALAWVVLVCGFIKTLIKLNLSTVNPQTRMSVYDTIQKFIIVGIGLVILIPAVQFLLECNDVIVELFASQVDTSSLNMPVVTNVLVQFLVGMMWITLLLYINFIYIMRSITVALLIASGPFFISTMAFGSGKSSLFASWAKELLANIFVQSVHAFVLSFLVQLLSTGSFLETFAIAISIIPITEMFRGLIFAGAGGSTSQLANSATSFTSKVGTAVGKTATGAIAGGMELASRGKSPSSESNKDGGKGGGGGGGKGGTSAIVDSRRQAKAEAMANGTSAGSKVRDSLSKKKDGTDRGGFGKVMAGVAGGAVDLAHMAAIGMPEAMENMMDMQAAMTDFALKGDASAMGKAVEKAGGSAVSGASSMAKGAMDGHRDKKNRQGQGSSTPSTSDKSQGAMATTDKGNSPANHGSTASGAKIQTTPPTTSRVVKEVNANSTDHQQVTGDQNVSNALAAYANGEDREIKAALIGKNNETGYQYSYTDANGQKQSFVVTNSDIQKAQNTSADKSGYTTSTVKAETSMDLATVGKDSSVSDRAHAAMTSSNGGHMKDSNGKSVNYRSVDSSGRVSDTTTGTIYQHKDDPNGERAVGVEHGTFAKGHDMGDAVSQYAQEKRDNGGAIYEQSSVDFGTYLNGQYGRSKNIDMTANYTDRDKGAAAMADAAMISKVGKAVEGKEGVYSFNGHEYNTGMTTKQADAVLAARGVYGVTNTSEKGASGDSGKGTIRYAQHTLSGQTSNLSSVQHDGGQTRARYDLQGMATFTQQGRSGGTFTFKNQAAAVQYFEQTGNISMANKVRAYDKNDSSTHTLSGSVVTTQSNGQTGYNNLATFVDNGNGGFSIQYNERGLKDEGIELGAMTDGSGFYASTNGNQVANPFYVHDSNAMGNGTQKETVTNDQHDNNGQGNAGPLPT